ncbi:60S acidic ribosomal protein P2 [Mycena olivaceomarginata]|nr:60S acidic ribosomal protein P2 [Mycena olivaceomarginata]
MCYLAAYLLLQIGISGNTSPSAADIKKLIGTVGIETDDERLDKLISELKGKSIDELITKGSRKLASVSSRNRNFDSGVLIFVTGSLWWRRWRCRPRCQWCRPCVRRVRGV